MTFQYGTTRMAGAFFVQYTDEEGIKWYGDREMNGLVGIFPTYGSLFDHFSQAFGDKKYEILSKVGNSFTLRVPTVRTDGTACNLDFFLERR